VLRGELGLPADYLSRMLSDFEGRGLIKRDGDVIELTEEGLALDETLDRRSQTQVGAILRARNDEQQRRLIEAMSSIRTILGEPLEERDVTIREADLGDHGWVVEGHAHLYSDQEGWDEPFVAMVAGIVAEYLDDHDAVMERAWIAELEGQRAGAVYCMRRSADVAQLRLLFVEDWARGLGIGGRLVDTCISFARKQGYKRMVLWTNNTLESARKIYDAAGFRQTSEEPHPVFPAGTVGQELWLDL
jgi:GNAT superfamily N-acetyltransferase